MWEVEGIISSKISQTERQIMHGIIDVWSLKNKIVKLTERGQRMGEIGRSW